MNLPRITALVPAGEHWDSSAMNEGIWLTVGHVNRIENALGSLDAQVSTSTTERTSLQQQLAISQQNAQAVAAQSQIDLAARDNKITNLENEIATLKKSPASEFTQTTTTQDVIAGNVVATAKEKYWTSYDDEMAEYLRKKNKR